MAAMRRFNAVSEASLLSLSSTESYAVNFAPPLRSGARFLSPAPKMLQMMEGQTRLRGSSFGGGGGVRQRSGVLLRRASAAAGRRRSGLVLEVCVCVFEITYLEAT